MKMPFGKYRDQELSNIPRPYLHWVDKNITDLAPPLRRKIHSLLGIVGDDKHDKELRKAKDKIAELENNLLQIQDTITDLFVRLAETEDARDQAREDLRLARAVKSTTWWAEWWRRATKLAHPDRSGNADLMALLNEADEKMR